MFSNLDFLVYSRGRGNNYNNGCPSCDGVTQALAVVLDGTDQIVLLPNLLRIHITLLE